MTGLDVPAELSLPVGEGEEQCYHLYCVVVHCGLSSDVGHYYSLVRDRQRGDWVRVSDKEVEYVQGWEDRMYSTRDTPYMLFYQRGRHVV